MAGPGFGRVDTVAVARGTAALLTVVMVWYFATSGAVRSDNLFLVPDLLVTVFALGSSLLPRRVAVPAMLFAYAWAAAVFTTSLFSYVVRGEFPVDHVFLILPSVVLAVLLGRIAAGRVPATRPAPAVPAPDRSDSPTARV
ncbi:hypothetical protein [Plantactinospora endophytica]|uniref:Uncharacterized protein n=1 Tax=Plantactinospora endophytica TaxID=673535 RepID=A0ABQ4E8P4_9ACTN|nr:hypothetical protein [Plantactinospora endophytica]GIG91105.1 hypothetical protein Pen02_60410 [Plantactinospora endophytica]